MHPFTSQTDALRFVAFVDRLYDGQVAIRAEGTPLDEVFPDDMLAGGYRKKYQRAISRLHGADETRGGEPGPSVACAPRTAARIAPSDRRGHRAHSTASVTWSCTLGVGVERELVHEQALR